MIDGSSNEDLINVRLIRAIDRSARHVRVRAEINFVRSERL